MLARSRSLAVFALATIAAACGSEATNGDAGGTTDGAPTLPGAPDGRDGGTTTAPQVIVDEAPVAMTQRLVGFDAFRGLMHPPSKRLFSLPEAISSSLSRVTVAKVGATSVDVTTLAVKGTVPTGRVESFAYEPTTDRIVVIVRSMRPHRIEVVTIALGDSEAQFEVLPQAQPLVANGGVLSALYPRGGGVLVVDRGNEVLTLSVTGGKAAWSAPQGPTGLMRGNTTSISLDAKQGRLIAVGREVFDPATMRPKYEPAVGTLPLSGPHTWTDVALGNTPPAESAGIYGPTWSTWHSTGNRVLAVMQIPSTCGGAPCTKPSLWAANLGQGAWTQVLEFFNAPTPMRGPFAVDDAAERIFAHSDGSLVAYSTATTSTMADAKLTQQGDLGPRFPSAAVVLSSGKILSSDGGVFRVLDPSAAAPRWERFGKTMMGQQIRYRPSLTEDPTTGEVLVFGGASTNASPTSSTLSILSKDGDTLTKADVPDGPAGRASHGAALVGRSLVIAGGYVGSGVSGALSDEVWAFDLGARTWKKLAALPFPIGNVSVRAVSDTEAWIVGFRLDGEEHRLSPIVAVDVAKGTATEVATTGAAPERLWSFAPYGSCFVGFESGDTVDGSEPTLWRCKKEGATIRWEKSALDADDYNLGGSLDLRGVASADGSAAYFVGNSLWAARPKP